MGSTRWLAAAAMLFAGVGLARGEERQPATQAGRDQLDAERRAIRIVARLDVQAALPRLEAEWTARTPGLLPETLARVHASIEEVLFMVALEVIDGDPRRPRVVEISAPPHSWFGTDVPGGRWGIDNPDTLYFTIPVEPDSGYVITGHRRAPGPVDSNFTVQTPDVWGAVADVGQRDLVVDTAGLAEGIVMLRWQLLSGATSGGPAVVSWVVTRATLADALPSGTEFVTPSGRDAQRAARAAGLARRFEDRFR